MYDAVARDDLSVSQMDIICGWGYHHFGQSDPHVCRIQLDTNVSTGNISHDQVNDPDLVTLSRWLQIGTQPSEGELALASPAAKYYWIHKDSFLLKSGVIWRRN